MKIYDITQEVFSCDVYPGDSKPSKRVAASMAAGDAYNLTEFSMCAHNGTHIDAPYHFFRDGKTVESIPLEHTVGKCFVIGASGEIDAAAARNMIKSAIETDGEAAQRILIKGDAVLTPDGARVWREAGVILVGSEAQSVGAVEAPAAVHRELLGADIVLIEGVRLDGVENGVYFLSAAPLKLGGCDGSPCRAVLIEM